MVRRLGVAAARPGYHRPVPPSRPPRHDARAATPPTGTVAAALSVPLLLGGLLVAGGAAAVRLSPAGGVPATESVMSVGGVLAAPATAPAARAVGLRRPVALFIGDSYAAGSGGAGVRRSFACLTARALGWVCHDDGEPGTGYTNAGKVHGAANDTYAARALGRTTAPAIGPNGTAAPLDPAAVDVVVVTGGRNDSGSPVPARVAAAGLTLDRLRVTYPNARIVVVGPFWVDDDVPPSLEAFDDGLRAEAAARSLTFLDPIRDRWLTTDQRARWIATDGVHPSVAGHQRIAARLVADLAAAGL